MSPNTLRSLDTIADTGLGAESLLALSSHKESLKELKLCFKTDVLSHLPLLQPCAALETVKLEDMDGWTDLDSSMPEVFSETKTWLTGCQNLAELEFVGFSSAPSLAIPLLSNQAIHLRKLSLNGYDTKSHRSFHRTLVHQQASLRSLFLSGDSDGLVRDDIDTLVESLSELKALRELELRGVSDFFKDEHINRLVLSLPFLEDFYTTGLELTDNILDGVGTLQILKTVTFAAISAFSIDGLLEFVSKLGQGNQGIVFSVEMADPASRLTEEEQSIVRDAFVANAGGRFEYTLLRGKSVTLRNFFYWQNTKS